MAKALTSTTAKVSITHDRISLTVKFVSGHVLKTAVNRYSDSFSVAAPVGAKTMSDVKPLWDFICKKAGDANHGVRFERLAKFFEGTTSIDDALVKAK